FSHLLHPVPLRMSFHKISAENRLDLHSHHYQLSLVVFIQKDIFMKIAHIAPPWLAIPPKNYGGTESILYHLIEEQVAQGHDVTLFAPGDARTSAKLISFFPH